MKSIIIIFLLIVNSSVMSGELGITIITNRAAPCPDVLSLQKIKNIYLLKKLSWSPTLPIVVVNREINSMQRIQFEKTLGISSSKYALYLKKMHYKGMVLPVIQNSRKAVIAFVENVPGSIAYIEGAMPSGYKNVKSIGYFK